MAWVNKNKLDWAREYNSLSQFCRFQFLFVKLSFFSKLMSQIDLATFWFCMIRQVLFFAHGFQETCRGWTSALQTILFFTSAVDWSLLTTFKKSHVFCLFLFLKPTRRSLTHFLSLSTHAQHCDNSEPQTDLDRRSWFFDGTFIRNSQKKTWLKFWMFLARKSNFFYLQSRFCLGSEHVSFVFVLFFVTAWAADGIVVGVCCFQLISAEIKLCLWARRVKNQKQIAKILLDFQRVFWHLKKKFLWGFLLGFFRFPI